MDDAERKVVTDKLYAQQLAVRMLVRDLWIAHLKTRPDPIAAAAVERQMNIGLVQQTVDERGGLDYFSQAVHQELEDVWAEIQAIVAAPD